MARAERAAEGSLSRLIADIVYRHRILLTALILAGAVVLAPRANITNIDNDLTAWFSREDPIFQEYERFQDEFGGTRTLIVAIEAPSRERLLSAEGFGFLERISGQIERVDAVDRVSSLATATVVDAEPPSTAAGREDGELRVRKLIEDLETRTPAEVGRRAMDDDMLRGDLIAADGTVAAVVVFFDERRIDDIRGRVIEQIRGILREDVPDGFRIHINGSLEISDIYNRITLENQTKFTPPILALTMIAIFAMFRSWRYTLLTIGAVLVSIIWTLGLYSLFGFTYNVLSSMIVPLVVVLAISDDVHILQHYGEVRRAGSAEHAFKTTVSHLVAPLFGASATTALGMASLAMSSVVAVRSFGLGSAIGVMVDFVISIVLVPTVLGWMRPEPARAPQQAWFEGPMRAIAAFTVRRARLVMTLAVAITVVSTAGLFRLRVDTNHINFFSPDHPLGSSAAVIDQRLAGIYSFQVFLEGPPDSLKQPDALKRMDRLQEDLRKLPFVRKVSSVADYVKRVHREIGADRTATIPDDPATIAQELFVFGLGDEGRVELERMAASDFSKAQIVVNLASMSSDLVFAQVNEAERMADAIFDGTGIRATVTGSGRLFATLDHYLVTSQISSFTTAFVTVFAVIFLIFRSWRFGALAIVPNLFPVLAVFGVMGWLDISLNVATVMLASVALGVVDDDTIHFISRYRKETARGAATREAIATATAHEGRAALTTALINSCAFGVLALSEYRPSAWFGGLLALTMVVAFLAEIFVLPATITLAPRLFGADRVHGSRRRSVPERGGRVMGWAAVAVAVAVLSQAGPEPRQATPPAEPSVARLEIGGDITFVADALPRKDAVEMRPQASIEATMRLSRLWRARFEGFAEALVADRDGSVTAGVLRAREAWIELAGSRGDVRVGYGRLVWGRLDEIQPSDVINPIDASRFLFEGRSAARLPVALIRGRVFASEGLTIEGVLAPVFRSGTFDELDEPTSPFNLTNDLVLPAAGLPFSQPIDSREPATSWRNVSGGGRVSATIGRVDIAAGAYRGWEGFGLLSFEPAIGVAPAVVGSLVETFPRFTMISADFEAVAGEWAIRGETAVFVEKTFQGQAGPVRGRAVDAGIGFDHGTEHVRLFGSVLLHRQWSDADATIDRTDVTAIGSVERDFGRERYLARVFGAWTPTDQSGFLRGVFAWSARDNVTVEASAAVFVGDGDTQLARFHGRDFVLTRVRFSW